MAIIPALIPYNSTHRSYSQPGHVLGCSVFLTAQKKGNISPLLTSTPLQQEKEEEKTAIRSSYIYTTGNSMHGESCLKRRQMYKAPKSQRVSVRKAAQFLGKTATLLHSPQGKSFRTPEDEQKEKEIKKWRWGKQSPRAAYSQRNPGKKNK